METFLGIMIPFLGTTLGAACVFFMKKSLGDLVQRALAGFAAGVMIIVYLFPSRRREAADGGADTDCGFILDERNGVDWSVDTGHIPHHLGSTVVLLFAVRHGTALPGELAAGFRVQTVGQHCHDSAVDFSAVQTDTGSNPVVVLDTQHHFVKQADFVRLCSPMGWFCDALCLFHQLAFFQV